jgi:hypothetical protein
MRQYLSVAAKVASRAALPKEVVIDARTTVLSLLLPGTATNRNNYKYKKNNMIGLFSSNAHS